MVPFPPPTDRGVDGDRTAAREVDRRAGPRVGVNRSGGAQIGAKRPPSVVALARRLLILGARRAVDAGSELLECLGGGLKLEPEAVRRVPVPLFPSPLTRAWLDEIRERHTKLHVALSEI